MILDVDPDRNYDFFSANNHPQCKYFSVPEYNSLLSSNPISIVNSNIRSFNRNFVTLNSMFAENNLPSIFCLTETRFSPSTVQDIPGYVSFHTLRDSDTPSGGVSLFIDESFNATKINSLSFSNSTIEICSIEFVFEKNHLIILAVYRPHSDSIDNFNILFADILNNKLLKNKNCIIVGDLNVCLLKPNNSNLDFSNLLFSHHYIPLITKATRFPQIDGEIPSCLDHIWINKFYDMDSGIIRVDISDHLPTFINLKLGSMQKDEKIKIQFRVVNDVNKLKFRNLLTSYDWNLIKSTNVHLYAEKFVETLDKLYCSAFPLKTKYVSKRRNHNPWITEPIRKLIEAKSDYFHLYRLSIVSLEENKRFRNKVHSIIRKQKSNYFSDILANSRNDIKKTWKIINNILSKNRKSNEINRIICNNVIYTDNDDIANEFNKFFCSIGELYDSKIPASDMDPCKFINVSHLSYFFLKPVSPLEVKFHIQGLKNSKQDVDSISIPIFKENSECLSYIIADLINKCFETGVFPKCFKKAIVLPLHKKECIDVMTNYRPISILPKLSKIIEKCLKSRLLHYFSRNNLFNTSQFGFLAEKSTQDALLHFTERIYDNLHKELSTLAIYVDFSKCFDTLNRKILIKKLEIYGIRGIPLELFKSYLDERYQAVKVNNVISEFKPINAGVPQGSVLGPILYLIYVNELPDISDQFSTCLFADDTTLIFENSNKYRLFNQCDYGVNLFFHGAVLIGYLSIFQKLT